MPKVDFREEVAKIALAELLEQRGLSEGRYVAERGRCPYRKRYPAQRPLKSATTQRNLR